MVGIPGVGKTTIVEKLSRAIKGSKVVTFGTVMLDEGKRLGWIRHRDELRKLPVEKQKQLQKLTATHIARMKAKVLFVDTHLFIRTGEGFWPGLPFEVVRALKPTHLVLVEADPKEILFRRQDDRTRYRDDITAKDLEGELSLARSFLTVSSTLTGAPMLIAANRQGKSTEVSKNLARVLTEAAR
ncbi:MAG TPA: adenylate kinase [Nitrososphaerales archaeon]|nr:adenylate kinase [Nitrososphaerales archaeon]